MDKKSYNESIGHMIYTLSYKGDENMELKNEVKLENLYKEINNCFLFDNKKINNFLAENNIVLIGGAIVSLLNKTIVNDYDLYICSNITIEQLKQKIEKYNQKNNESNLTFLYESNNSISYKMNDINYGNIMTSSITLQFIKLPHLMNKTINEIFDSIDFSICKCAYSFTENMFIFNDEFLESYTSKFITFNMNTLYPISSLLRVKKYEQKGYNFLTEEMLKICFAINNLKIKTYKDVVLHLTAVSTSYYSDFLELLLTDDYKDMKFNGIEFFKLFDQYQTAKKIVNKLVI